MKNNEHMLGEMLLPIDETTESWIDMEFFGGSGGAGGCGGFKKTLIQFHKQHHRTQKNNMTPFP
ncbi:hypothetical protein [Pseudomonas sp. R5(2019)]|uniref:hypothetical protein n=1 Tax=Pseudomonas sp. R5(2019) TaxID=2697566 RepID=UPI001412E9B9|nr:hypothetical protein [Pseudomonas sp. R5(2019)]NBA94217.1 hypothetical protein [Pseudomonas sp. R5(2019)]